MCADKNIYAVNSDKPMPSLRYSSSTANIAMYPRRMHPLCRSSLHTIAPTHLSPSTACNTQSLISINFSIITTVDLPPTFVVVFFYKSGLFLWRLLRLGCVPQRPPKENFWELSDWSRIFTGWMLFLLLTKSVIAQNGTIFIINCMTKISITDKIINPLKKLERKCENVRKWKQNRTAKTCNVNKIKSPKTFKNAYKILSSNNNKRLIFLTSLGKMGLTKHNP